MSLQKILAKNPIRGEIYQTAIAARASQRPVRRTGQHLKPFKFVDLFCGIGGFHQAAKSLKGICVFACDTDEHARHAYEANYRMEVKSDITKIKASDVPDHDFLFAGFPCQPFSIIGYRHGFQDTRGTLFFEIMRIMKAKRPRMALLENVKQLTTHNNGDTLATIIRDLEQAKYSVHVAVLNALDYGLPQKRERTLLACFRNKSDSARFEFPKKSRTHVPLSRILEKNVPRQHYASRTIVSKRKSMHTPTHTPSIWHENKGGHISSYPYSCAIRAGASYNYLLVNGERRPTPRELLRLQGFPNSFKIVCADGQVRKQAGNAVPIPMIRKVIRCVRLAAS